MNHYLTKIVLAVILIIGLEAAAQTPTITVRFANPEYDVSTQTYCVDVEFQSDIPNKQVFAMNVRFFYDEDVLEFNAFGEFAQGYGPITPNPPIINTLSATSGPVLFGFGGAAEYVNGAIQKISTSSVIISTTGWTKLFNVCFHVDDPNAMNGDFCPSIVWDLEENPLDGGFFPGSDGVVITVVAPPPNQSEPANRNVVQFNWDYDYVPGYPFGGPENNICVSNRVAPTTKIHSTLANSNGYVTFPFLVWNFIDIGSFSLTVDYDPAVLEYCCAVPNSVIAANFDTTLIYSGRIQMTSTGFNASLPDSSVIFYATFKYTGSTSSTVAWCDDGGSCEYVDANNNQPLPDEPTSTYYFNGNVATGQFIWSGASSSDWLLPANWQGGLIPTAYDNVTINSSPLPPNWPAYDGDFTLGTQCKDLTINGDAQLTVTGDVTIDPGHVLTIANTGEIIVGGDWTNSGIFNPGTGDITFNGAGTGYILNGVPPENYVAGFNYSTFSQGMTVITGGINGPSGDNAHSDVPIGFTFSYLGIDYSQLRINTNGWLSFNLTGTDAVSNDNLLLYSTNDPTTVVAPWWDDLRADGSASISYLTQGTAPNRVFTVEWKNVLAFTTGSTTRLNFQVKLFETTNVIEFHYGNVVAGTHNTSEGASMGIKDATGGPGNYMEALYGTTNMMAGCLVSDLEWPTTNYRYTPPTVITTETFHHIFVTGELRVQRDVVVTGLE